MRSSYTNCYIAIMLSNFRPLVFVNCDLCECVLIEDTILGKFNPLTVIYSNSYLLTEMTRDTGILTFKQKTRSKVNKQTNRLT